MKTKITRIPESLDRVCLNFQADLGLKTKVETFDRIASVGEDFIKFLKNNKRGQLLELVGFSFVLIVVVLFFAISGTSMTGLQSNLNESTDSSIQAVMPEVNSFIDNVPSWVDFAIGSLFFLYLAGLFIINFFIGSNILFSIFYFLSMFFFGSIIKMFASAMGSMQDSELGIYIAQLPITTFIFNNFYVIMMLFFIVMMLLLFAKPSARSGA